MEGIERRGMAGGAVAGAGKRLARGLVDQPTLGIMTRGAGVMHLGIGRIDQRRRIAVTVAAASGLDLDQRGMIDVRRDGTYRRGRYDRWCSRHPRQKTCPLPR